MDKAIVAYVPVLHRGYRDFFERHSDIGTLLVFGRGLVRRFDHLRKDIRALDPLQVVSAVKAWGIFSSVGVLGPRRLEALNRHGSIVVLPDEDISRELVAKHLSRAVVRFDSVFLRRDRKKTTSQVIVAPDRTISVADFDRGIMALAEEEAQRSPDWWYHVGAAAVRDGSVLILAHNSYVPSPHTAYAFGDPRIHFKAGVSFELTQVLHAEAAVVCEAAKRGVSLDEADFYTTMFPCPWCAKMIAYSGISRVFFCEGYSRLDGESILKVNGVEIIQVK